MALGGYMAIGGNAYKNCEVTYEYPDVTSTCSTWVEYGTGTMTTPRIKIKAYRAGTASSCMTYDSWEGVSDVYGPTKNIWKVSSAASTACTIQWGMWGYDEYTVECEWQGGIVKPMSAEEKKAYEEKRLKERFSQIIQGRCAPNVIIRQNTKRQPLPIPADIREQRARETLRRVIGDQKYINFIKHGFISVKGRSGFVYQIFTGHGITHVFDQGNLVERLCVVLQGSFPPTDSLIMRYLLILNNEQQFRSLAIKHSISGYERSRQDNGPVAIKPLAEIFKELKSKVA